MRHAHVLEERRALADRLGPDAVGGHLGKQRLERGPSDHRKTPEALFKKREMHLKQHSIHWHSQIGTAKMVQPGAPRFAYLC